MGTILSMLGVYNMFRGAVIVYSIDEEAENKELQHLKANQCAIIGLLFVIFGILI